MFRSLPVPFVKDADVDAVLKSNYKLPTLTSNPAVAAGTTKKSDKRKHIEVASKQVDIPRAVVQNNGNSKEDDDEEEEGLDESEDRKHKKRRARGQGSKKKNGGH
jgi:hypothetical protein